MSELLFQVRGKTIRAKELPRYAEPAKPRVAKERAASHNGFAVEGFSPWQLQLAHELADARMKEWRGKSEEEKLDYLRAQNKEPKPWDEANYVRKTKPKRIAKPYATPQAAAECMALAIKTGWQYVRVTELIRDPS